MYLFIIQISLLVFAILEIFRLPINGSLKAYKIIYVLYLIFFIILSSIRWETGTDWPTYYSYFTDYRQHYGQNYLEPLFNLLNYINAQYFSYTFQLFQIALLSIIPIGFRYSKMSPYPLLTLFIWFSIIFCHIFPVRQTISISIIVFCWKYIEEHNFRKYLIGVIVAGLFHYSSLIALPIYFIWHLNFRLRTLLSIIVISSLIGVIMDSVLQRIIAFVGGGIFEEKINYYLENASESFGSQFSPRQVLIRGIVNRLLIILIPLFLLNDKRNNARLNALFNLSIYSYVLFVCTSPLSVALARLTIFSDMQQALLIPYLFTLKSKVSSKIIFLIILFIYFEYRFSGVIFNYKDLYIPYKSIL